MARPAALVAAGGADPAIAFTPAGHAPAVRHFGYHRLAGYHQLTRRSRVGGILYRLGVQLRPLVWFLPRRPDEPWDDAWLARPTLARLAALAAGCRAARP